MAKQTNYNSGGDAQAIQSTAQNYYGSYLKMFEAHGWSERGRQMLTAVQTRVVATYGSVKAFEEMHATSNGLMFPMGAIYKKPPNVWLTSFYGFRPESWGFVGFSNSALRANFLRNTVPGVLVVIYGAGKAPKDMRGLVIGILQCSHETGHAKEFMSPSSWNEKEADPIRKNKWNYGVRAVQAWRVKSNNRPVVRDFAPDATSTEAWQHVRQTAL